MKAGIGGRGVYRKRTSSSWRGGSTGDPITIVEKDGVLYIETDVASVKVSKKDAMWIARAMLNYGMSQR